MNKKPIYTVHFCSSNPKYTISGTGLCPVKANDEQEAKYKFLNRYKGLTEEDNILSCDLLESDDKHYHRLSSHAF